MSKEKKLIPELRFPEFLKDGEWVEKKLGEIGEPLMCKRIFKGQTTPNSENGIPFYKIGTFGKEPDSYISVELYEEFKAKYNFPNKGDILISASGTIGRLVVYDGEPAYYQDSNIVWLGHDETEVSNEFLFYFYSIVNWQTSDGGVIKRLYNSDLKAISIKFPENEQEQQKIAACLSSLDELITAHNDKLQALKDHKKGLMQNLFPREGEKVPKYRFSEFEKDGEWVEMNIGDCLLQKPEYGINAPAVPYSENIPTYLRITDISEDGIFLSKDKVSVNKDVTINNYLTEGDIVFARTGASVGKSYKYRKKDGKLVFAGFLIRVKPNPKKMESEFLYQFLATEQYWRWVSFVSARSGQPGINGTQYSSMPISVPQSIKEQQKIASCLSALDELIMAQAEKIKQLQQHKKGLMQGLFPKIND